MSVTEKDLAIHDLKLRMENVETEIELLMSIIRQRERNVASTSTLSTRFDAAMNKYK